jgi:hypothetical protein
MPEPLTGGCGCGAVRYELTQPPLYAIWCHCTRCQRRTGSGAALTARVEPGSVRVLEGEDRIRRWSPGEGRDKAFCVDCGSGLFAERAEDGAIFGVRMGTFDRDPGVRPTMRQFTAYAPAWDPIPDDGLPRHPERAPA